MSVWNVEERDDGIVIAAHNNPPHNYFIGESATGLAEMLPRWREPDVRVVILTGAVPDRYITHYSVEELLELAEDREALIRASNDLIDGWHTLLGSLRFLDKPIIAAMTGDDRRRRPRAVAELRHPHHAARRLHGRLPRGRARHPHRHRLAAARRARSAAAARSTSSCAAATSRPEGALELGIVNELADDAKARAIEVAERLAKASPVALTAAKRSVVRGSNLPLQEGVRVEADEWLKTMATEQAIDLMKDYVAQPFEERLNWVRDHGAWPEPGSAIGS